MTPDLFDKKHDQDSREFHAQHPEVMRLFELYTLQLIRKGYDHGGAKMIWERVRWDTSLDYSDRELKLNNNYTAWYARQFMQAHPEHDGFFRTRERAAA